MIAYLRVAAGLLSCLVVAGVAWASSEMDALLNIPNDVQACSLPSVTASSPMTQDASVQLASADQPVANNTAVIQITDQNSCGACDACSSCPCYCPPVWDISAGAVFLHRDRPTAGSIAGAFPTGVPAFTRGSDFDFGWDAGPDITIDRRIGDDNFLDVRYFNSYETADIQFRTPGNFIGAGFTGPANTLFVGQAFTKLNNTEVNWRRQEWDQLALLVGFRWVELQDNATYHIGPTAEGSYDYNNQLYGGQIGADWALTGRCNPLQINVVGKAGVYGNADEGGITQFVGGTPVGRFGGQGSSTAFVGETDFSLAYILTRHIAVHGGYQLLWLSDLALATDAASRSLTNPSLLRTVDSTGDLFYQGATVGIDFVW